MKATAVPDKQTVESVDSKLITQVSIGAASANVGTVDEEVAAAAVPDQYSEEYVKYEVLPEKY